MNAVKPKNAMRSFLHIALLIYLLAAMSSASAFSKRQSRALTQSQDNFAAMIRWNEFETAWRMVDPEVREKENLGETHFERYRQIQVTSYQPLSSDTLDSNVIERLVEIRLVNRHTLAERSIRYRERWRWDRETKRWWLVSGLPDFWDGQ